MRLREFVTLSEDGTGTVSGSIAPVVVPVGGMITRNGGDFFTGAKYSTDSTPNTPAWMKQLKTGKSHRAK
jgi:hypothetical protein